MTTDYSQKDRVALFTADKGPASLGGPITVGGTEYRAKLMKAHPNERGAGYLSIELRESPYSTVGGGFLMPSKQDREGGALLYGTVTVKGADYKVNLYKGEPGKPVLSGPLHRADEPYTKPTSSTVDSGAKSEDSNDW